MFKKAIKYILIILISLVIITILILKPIKVQGNSMYPAFKDGDWAVINKLAYIISKPKRGDFVVYDLPNHKRKLILKRIIGLEEETIEIKSGSIYINDSELHESFGTYIFSDSFHKRTIPKGNFFVLGDNRKVSIDSRYEEIGFIDKKYIVGKIIFKW